MDIIYIDELHEEKQFVKIFNLFKNYFKEDDNYVKEKDIDILWRYARSFYDSSSEYGITRNNQEKLLRQGYKITKQCLLLDRNNFYSHKWTAVFLSALSEFNGIKSKIDSAFKIKEHCDIANSILDQTQGSQRDGTLEHLLGRWCFRIASVTWIERKLAKTIIAELPESPEEATYENALSHFILADSLKKNFVINALWCGKTYQKLGDIKNAKIWYRKAYKMKQTSTSDKYSAKEASKLLSKL